MKTKLLLCAAIAAVISTQANAFRFEANLNKINSDVDIESDFDADIESDVDLLTLDATYYFQDVSLDKGPWREAAFLSKASSVSLQLSDGEVDYNSVDIKGKAFAAHGVFGSFVIDASFSQTDYDVEYNSGIYSISIEELDRFGVPPSDYQVVRDLVNLDAGFREFILDLGFNLIQPSETHSTEVEDIRITLGRYVGDNQQWWVTGRSGEDGDYSDYKGLGGGYKTVMAIDDGQYLTFDASLDILDIDSNYDADLLQTELNVGMSYYPIVQLAIFIDIESVAALDSDSDNDYDYGDDPDYSLFRLTVGVSYYPIENIHLSASVSSISEEYEYNDNFYSEESETDTTTLTLGLGMRF